MIIEPVALSRDVPPARVMRAQLGELDLAIWRSESGTLSAWENRCPHRGMRLSHGFVRGERLACLYHGWHYSTDGFCEIIPAHPELTPPKTFCTVQYYVIESAGVIWVSNNRIDTQDSKPAAPPAPPALPAGLQPIRSISFSTTAKQVIKALVANPPANMSVAEPSEQFIQLNNKSTNQHLVLLLHSESNTDNNNVTVHVLGSENYGVEDLIQLSRWCESVRRIAEHTDGANT